MHTFIKPAKQWTSIPRGTTPLFSWFLTYASWLLSAFIRKIPSAFENTRKHPKKCLNFLTELMNSSTETRLVFYRADK